MSSQQAPSLDAIAGSQSATARAFTSRDDDQEDSRSTSSASSPLPAEYEESDFFHGANDSQSSLGVPNLQDMQVTDDEECLPPVNRLPNEILISIFAKLSSASDQLHCMLVCKRWSRNAVDLLWHRPACTSWTKHATICQTLGLEQPYFAYRDFIKRLNLAALADKVNDGSVMPLAVCNRVERLTLTSCKGLTDTGLIALVTNSDHLLALDISGDIQITESSIVAIAQNCNRLQGLNVSNCVKISNESMITLAENCKFVKRLKLNDCHQLNDDAILAFAENCPNILEIDLHQCRLIGNAPITNLLSKGQSLRELRLANCELIDDNAFLSLPMHQTYEHLRILDLTSCSRLTDRAVEKIIDAAPRLRNLVLAKCRNITNQAVYAISRLGKNLHYVHLGHCVQLTDDAVKKLVQCCNRIRYIDLGCCTHLTDASVTKLATLPKLKRIGLVKCHNITDESVYALAKANQRYRQRRDPEGRNIGEPYPSHSSLERVHLSYCTSLTLKSIIKLLSSCPRLTHLSLTGVQAFLRTDLEAFCRDAPPEFTDHQRAVFCVFSGNGVNQLRRYLNNEEEFAEFRDESPSPVSRRPMDAGQQLLAMLHQTAGHAHNAPDGGFDDQEPDVVDDDDGLEDGSEMVIDTAPLLGQNNVGHGVAGVSLDANIIPPPPPVPAMAAPQWPAGSPAWLAANQAQAPNAVPQQLVRFPADPQQLAQTIPNRGAEDDDDAMDVSPSRPNASTAPLGIRPFTPAGASGAASSSAAGPSTANLARGRPATPRVQFDGSDNGGGSSRSSPDIA